MRYSKDDGDIERRPRDNGRREDRKDEERVMNEEDLAGLWKA